MAGHSAWKNIKHKKAANDARRGKAWTKCARAIIVAAKHGGGDPNTNLSLRYAIDEAKAVNMPKDTIEKAVKKGTGELGTENYESAVYEGYGPCGVAILLEILTNNRHRTAPDVKGILDKRGGNLGSPGSVGYNFPSRGQILIAKSAVAEEQLMSVALEAGALDVTDEGEEWQVICEPADFMRVRTAIEQAKIPISSAQMTRIPATTVTCTGEDARRLLAADRRAGGARRRAKGLHQPGDTGFGAGGAGVSGISDLKMLSRERPKKDLLCFSNPIPARRDEIRNSYGSLHRSFHGPRSRRGVPLQGPRDRQEL